MFDNIGAKIKGYAKIVFAVMAIIGVIGAIVSGIAVGGGFGFLLFILLCALALVVSYLSVIFIYGFGELVENSTLTRELTKHIFDITYNTYSEVYDSNHPNEPTLKKENNYTI